VAIQGLAVIVKNLPPKTLQAIIQLALDYKLREKPAFVLTCYYQKPARLLIITAILILTALWTKLFTMTQLAFTPHIKADLIQSYLELQVVVDTVSSQLQSLEWLQ
jgi:hypothetical protein